MLITQSNFVGWEVEQALKLLCDQKDRLTIEWEAAVTPFLKKGTQIRHLLSSSLVQFCTHYRKLHCFNYYFFFFWWKDPTYSPALSHQYGVKYVVSWGKHTNQELPAHKQGKKKVLGNWDYCKPKKDFFTRIFGEIKQT